MKPLFVTIILCLVFQIAKAEVNFAENQGQFLNQFGEKASAQFVLYQKGFNVQIKNNGFSYDFYRHVGDSVYFQRVDFEFQNSNSNCHFEKTPSLHPRQFKELKLSNVYNGIDILFRTTSEGVFEYDFIVGEFGDINDIKIEYSGVEIVEAKGDEIYFKNDQLLFKEKLPNSYYFDGRQAAVNFITSANNFIQFQTNDNRNNIVIDPSPELLYASYWLGDESILTGIATSPDAYYVLGSTSDIFFTVSEGAYQTSILGTENMVLSKFSMTNELIWSTFIGKGGQLSSSKIELIDNEIYILGTGYSNNIESEGGFQSTNAGETDVYLAKFSLNGEMLYNTYLGGSGFELPTVLKADQFGRIIVGGYTESSNFPIANSTLAFNGIRDAFITVFDRIDMQCLFSGLIGGAGEDWLEDIEVDFSANICAVGGTYSFSFNQESQQDILPDYFNSVALGGNDAYLCILNSDYEVVDIGFMGGEGYTALFNQIQQRSDGQFVLIGYNPDENIPVSADAQEPLPFALGGNFILITDENFEINYCSFFGNTCTVSKMILDDDDQIYITGFTSANENIASPFAFQPEYHYNPEALPSLLSDGFIMKFYSNGHTAWGSYIGTYSFDFLNDLSYLNDEIFIVGSIQTSANYSNQYQEEIITSDAIQSDLGIYSGFISRFGNLTDVEEFEKDIPIKLYPNPSTQEIQISDLPDRYEIEIYNSNGQIIQLVNGSSSTVSITTDHLAAGLYLVKIKSNNTLKSSTFLKL